MDSLGFYHDRCASSGQRNCKSSHSLYLLRRSGNPDGYFWAAGFYHFVVACYGSQHDYGPYGGGFSLEYHDLYGSGYPSGRKLRGHGQCHRHS